MKKSISAAMVLIMVLINFSTILSNNLQSNPQTLSTYQSTIMSNIELQSIEGGLPAMDCALLLTTCMAVGGAELGWVGLLICSGLAAYCLAA